MKWNGKIESLYMLAIVHQKNLESLRSLSGIHIELLENIKNKSLASIESKFGLKKDKIRGNFDYILNDYFDI
jgi:m7GpppX diphosphatase